MSGRTVTRAFTSYDEAVQAVYELEQAGIPADHISLVGADSDPRISDAVTNDAAESPAGLGATIGATAGGGAGLLAGIGAIMIPGIGPLIAAGWFITALTGAGIGAAAGGIVGALTHLGVTDDQAHVAKDAIQRGGTVVMVRAEADRGEAVDAILHRDRRAEAALFEQASPIVANAPSAGSEDYAQGDYGDELGRIDRMQDRINRSAGSGEAD